MSEASRVATTKQVREIARLGEERGLNRRIPANVVPRLRPGGKHLLSLVTEHAFADGQPVDPHMRCHAMLALIGTGNAYEMLVDVPMEIWDRLKAVPRRIAKPDPDWVEVSEMLGALQHQVATNPPALTFTSEESDASQDRPVPMSWVRDLDPYWVDPMMLRVVRKAAQDAALDVHEIALSDPLTPRGFVVLPEVVFLPHEEWVRVPIRALSWVTVPEGIWAMTWIDLGHPDAPWGIEAGDGQRLWPAVYGLIVPGESVGTPRSWVNASEEMKQTLVEVRRLFLAMWIVSSSRVGMVRGTSLPRGLRRQAQRRKEPTSVLVISLRRSEPQGLEPRGLHVEWSHRWLVSGYWRRRWRGDTEGVRMEWVSPHVKGPEDKPLVLKDRFYRLER